MRVKLHANATSTPRTRKYIQDSKKSAVTLLKDIGIAESTIRIWRKGNSAENKSHTAHNLQTTLSKPQEWLVVELRQLLLLSLDDLLVVARKFINPDVSRSGLDRCLWRHGVSNLKNMIPETEPKSSPKKFKDYDPGCVHVDLKYLPQMQDEEQRKYLYVGIDRATRWVYFETMSDKKASTLATFLRKLKKAAPFKITIVLTDNGKEFTDRFCARGERELTRKHLFDLECAHTNIEHRLIEPMHSQINGMVERFTGRVATILQKPTNRQGHDMDYT